MKFAAAILIAVFVTVAEGANKCAIQDGHDLEQFSKRTLKMMVPCKYNAVLQQCGPYKVTVTPGQRWLYPTYIIDSVWIAVENTETGHTWEGRSSNKLAALYIVKGEEGGRSPISKKEGDYNTEDLFTITSTTKDVTIAEKKGVFSITVGPFDFNGNKNRDSRMEFVCNAEDELEEYPKQFCGSKEGKEIKVRTEKLFINKKRIDLTIMHDVFTDTSVVQTNPLCKESVRILTQDCANETERAEAIKTCHHILDSNGHTECVVKFACDPMDVFKNCLQYACSGYTDEDACERVGQAIDMCREFPELTPKVKEANCYKDLLTAEDNPYYVSKKSKKNKN
ncbi:uncharacterized protein [Littorina saxatilis]|uniref:Uncharacterized protein n=1 Tax=Littorina saxatilis TaxID=31220 RepID=A0AAN9BL41_9CAEN